MSKFIPQRSVVEEQRKQFLRKVREHRRLERIALIKKELEAIIANEESKTGETNV